MKDKPLVWLHGEIRPPPLSSSARVEASYLLRQVQSGLKLSLPHSRPMPIVGPGCHELRIVDATRTWRIFYSVDRDAIVILDVFEKKSQKTLSMAIENCKRRLQLYKASATSKKKSCDLYPSLFRTAVVPASKTRIDLENTITIIGSGTSAGG